MDEIDLVVGRILQILNGGGDALRDAVDQRGEHIAQADVGRQQPHRAGRIGVSGAPAVGDAAVAVIDQHGHVGLQQIHSGLPMTGMNRSTSSSGRSSGTM